MAAIEKQHSTNKMKMMTMTMTCRADQLTREPSNISNYEGYHGGEAASVPFTWESQPGTPKVKFRDTTVPPLTPPPSYSYNTSNNRRSIIKAHKKNSSSSSKPSSLFYTIFPKRVTTRKARVPPSPSSPANSSLSSCSSSLSSSCNSSSPVRLRSRSVPASPMRCPRKLDREDETEDEDLYDVRVSRLCFGNARSRGCYSSMIKKVLLGDFL